MTYSGRMTESEAKIIRRKSPGSVTYRFWVQVNGRKYGPFATKASAQSYIDRPYGIATK